MSKKNRERRNSIKEQIISTSEEKPIVDIIIPVHNKPDLLRRCIERLESSVYIPYKLTLVDDGSTDKGVQDYFRGLDWHTNKITLRSNVGFPEAVNRGVRSTSLPYVCILNQDTEGIPGWLDMMMEVIKRDDVGVVGPLLLFHPNSRNGPGGYTQHAGIYFSVNRVPKHRFIGWPADHPRVQTAREDLQAVTGACFLTKRSLWQTIGGFAREYGRGTFEDVEFCIKAKWLGNKIAYCPEAMLYHWVGGTIDDGEGYNLQENYQTFMSRVGGNVIYDEWKVL